MLLKSEEEGRICPSRCPHGAKEQDEITGLERAAWESGKRTKVLEDQRSSFSPSPVPGVVNPGLPHSSVRVQ